MSMHPCENLQCALHCLCCSILPCHICRQYIQSLAIFVWNLLIHTVCCNTLTWADWHVICANFTVSTSQIFQLILTHLTKKVDANACLSLCVFLCVMHSRLINLRPFSCNLKATTYIHIAVTSFLSGQETKNQTQTIWSECAGSHPSAHLSSDSPAGSVIWAFTKGRASHGIYNATVHIIMQLETDYWPFKVLLYVYSLEASLWQDHITSWEL